MIYVEQKNYSTAVGLELAIFGGFFDSDCSVKIGLYDVDVLSVEDDCITCSVPEVPGKYQVVVSDGHGANVNVGEVNVVLLSDFEKVGSPIEYKFKDFLGYVNGLLPKVSSIFFSTDSKDFNAVTPTNKLACSNFGKVFWAIAYAIQYAFGFIRSVSIAINPLTTENIDDWENELDLPIKGYAPTTAEKRKMEILRVACKKGGCTVNYFKRLLKLIGVDAEIYEYWKNPEYFGLIPVPDYEKNFYWVIRENDLVQTVHTLKCNGKCNMPLRWWTDTAIKTLLNKLKPAHTKLLFAKKWTEVHYNLIAGDNNLIAGDYNLVASRLEDLIENQN